MSLKLVQNAALGCENSLSSENHILLVLDDAAENTFPYATLLQAKLKRSKSALKDLIKAPVTIELPHGGIASVVVLENSLNAFQKHTLLRKAIKPLLTEQPEQLALCVFGPEAERKANACAAYYVATVNAAELPSRKNEHPHTPLKAIHIYGWQEDHDYAYTHARVAGNT
ncbi:MAG TPA: leucyl aminopeptidase family protein, partial [Methylophilaceae bacterium]|nr:leucyl aminopeptidase family protein [Methylophilaceae bacterium]